MKTIKFLSVLIMLYVCCNNQHSLAQSDPSEFRNELRFGAFQLLYNTFYASYERSYGNNGTSFSAVFTYKDTYEESVTGYLLKIDQKIYFNDVTSDYGNFYFSPGLKYGYREYVGTSYTDKLTSYGVQVVGGVKYTILNRLVIDFYFGGTIVQTLIQKTGTSDKRYGKNYLSPGYSGVAPIINCTFGFKF